MRLIDADELIKDRVGNDPVVIAAKCQPTAYDVDKVVEQIEREIGDCMCEECDRHTDCDTCRAEKAVEIVKSGGIAEEKKAEWKEQFANRFSRIE